MSHKILFLDIDGVLNSEEFYKDKPDRNLRNEPFDLKCVEQLQRIVQATDAKIVLTSSWRGGWDPDPEKCHVTGTILNKNFADYGMTIYSKTPSLAMGKRPLEVAQFLKDCDLKIDQYVIIDDNNFHWSNYDMDKHFVQTDFLRGGLKAEHADQAIAILQKKASFFEKRKFKKLGQ